MSDTYPNFTSIDWREVTATMHDKGYAILPHFLSEENCEALIALYDCSHGYRKTVVMERYRFGRGEYKYWAYPLPGLVEYLRTTLYPYLAPIANHWMQLLRIEKQFPETLKKLQSQCHVAGQLKPTPLILRYGQGGFNTLHQDIYGEVYFPIQAACILNQVGEDFEGGEFVLTEQTPRAQSKAIVLAPNRGDLIIFTTQFRPKKGLRGFYRATIKHGVSEVLCGERHTLGLIFHDAVS